MFELNYIELDRLLKLRPAMDYETGGLEFHVRAIQLFGCPVIWINSDTKHILTNPQEVKALASMKKARQPRPRFVRGDGDEWLIPLVVGS